MKYAVVKKWKDNISNFQVLEYFETIEEAEIFISKQKKSVLYNFEVMKYV